MTSTQTMQLYDTIHQSNQQLMAALNVSYLEALAETLQNLTTDQKAQQIDGLPTDDIVAQLTQLYQAIPLETLSAETIRKAIQLSFLQAIKTDAIQPNHYITPDSIAFFIAYLVNKLVAENICLLDICAGSGNLLSVLANQLTDRVTTIEAVEVDDVLVALLATQTQLQQCNVKIFHQDSVLPLFVSAPNVIVSDLPIGFYPYDDKVASFKVSVKNGHTYAHHALIENSLSLLQPNGWAFYLVPANVFDTNQSQQLLQLLTQDNYYLQGFLTLPKTLFKNESAQKGILIVQKRGEYAKKANNVLLGEVPSFKDVQKFSKFITKFNEWANEL